MFIPSLVVIAVLALAFISYMKNKQANRREERRERFLEKQEELLERLRKDKTEE